MNLPLANLAPALLTLAAVAGKLAVTTGMTQANWPQALWGWWVAVAFVLAQLAAGALLTARLLPAAPKDAAARLLVSFIAGSYITLACLLLLALAGALNGVAAAIVAGLGVLAVILALRSGLLQTDLRMPAYRLALPAWLVALAALAWLAPYLLQTLLPDHDWDGATHHLPMAQRYAEGLIHQVDPVFPAWSFPGAMHLVYALFLLLGAESAIIPFNFLAAAGSAALVYLIAREAGGARAGLWALAVSVSINLLWELGLDSRVDGLLAFYVLAGSYAGVRWVRTHESVFLPACAAAFGLGCGIKYTGLVFAAVAGVTILLLAATDRAYRPPAWRKTAALALVVLMIPSGWWYARNLAAFGDPVYPLVGGIKFQAADGELQKWDEVMPALRKTLPEAPVFKTLGLQGYLLDPLPTSGIEPGNMLNLVRVLTRPDEYARSKQGHTLGPLILLFFLLPLLCRSPACLFLLAVGLGAFAILGSQAFLVRYALPAWLLFAAGAGVVMSRVTARLPVIAAIAVLALGIGHDLRFEYGKLKTMQPLAWLGGQATRLQWLSLTGYHNIRTLPLFLADLQRLPAAQQPGPNDTVMMVGEGKSHLLAARSLPDMSWNGYRWLAQLGRHGADTGLIAAELRRRGVGWILFNYAFTVTSINDQPWLYDEIALTFYHLVRFLQAHGEPVMDSYGIALFRLHDGEPEK